MGFWINTEEEAERLCQKYKDDPSQYHIRMHMLRQEARARIREKCWKVFWLVALPVSLIVVALVFWIVRG